MEVLAERYEQLLSNDLPLTDAQRRLLRGFAPTFARWCDELGQHGIAATVQHDDLHHNNLYLHEGRSQILDWGDTSIGHPFASLVVTFQFLEQVNRLDRTDPWFARLRDAYLEPWGPGYADTFRLAMGVGAFAHAIAWVRQRTALPAACLADFDAAYRGVLGRAAELALVNR